MEILAPRESMKQEKGKMLLFLFELVVLVLKHREVIQDFLKL